ncbi:hypothetical protein KCU66_g48, partial [Aureobasidium melanogenum]
LLTKETHDEHYRTSSISESMLVSSDRMAHYAYYGPSTKFSVPLHATASCAVLLSTFPGETAIIHLLMLIVRFTLEEIESI